MHSRPSRPAPGLGEGEPLLSSIAARDEDTQRVTCVHAERCGGCPVIALPYGEQLALKRGRVVQSLARYPSLELVYTEPVQAATPITAYRTRAKLMVAPGARVGLYAKGGGHQVVDIPECQVVSPAVSAVAAVLRRRIAADEAVGGPLAPYDPSGGGALRALDLREIRPEDEQGPRVLVTFVAQRDRIRDREALAAAAREIAAEEPLVLGIALNLHDGDSPQILGSETVVLHGVTAASDRIGVARHEATYGSFVQAHRGQAERVHTTVVELLGIAQGRTDERTSTAGPTSSVAPSSGAASSSTPASSTRRRPRILDLYGGSGAIALALAHSGADVHLVESFAPAVAHVEGAARRARLSVHAEAADVATALRRIAEQGSSFDAAVVNPPRRGMSPLARELLTRLELPAIAYVSCDPDTLARDLDHFTRLGYGLSTLRPLDMIPLTDEVETIALLRRTALTPPRVVWEDDEVLIVDKAAHEPTSPQGEYRSSLVARARRLADAGDVVPVHRIDVGTSGLVLLARRPELAARWQAVLADASTRQVFLCAARGVTPSKGAITRDLREDGRMLPARTRYRRLAVASGHSVLRVVPELSRTHQIRRHLAAIGHPILGDERYGHGPTNRYFEEKNALDRTFLHCVRIELTHPTTQQRLVVEAPLPGDLRAVLERTSGPGTLRFLEQKHALGSGSTGLSTIPPPPSEAAFSSFPPPPSDTIDLRLLDVDPSSASTPTIRPQLTTDDDA